MCHEKKIMSNFAEIFRVRRGLVSRFSENAPCGITVYMF